MKYNVAIFDLDGTLLDTLKDLAISANYALEKNNFSTLDINTIKSYVGNGVAKLIDRCLPTNVSQSVFDKVLSDFLTHYALHKEDNTQPFDGIYKLLEDLKQKGVKIAILSNKYHKATVELSKKLFNDSVLVAKGMTVDMPPKPAPDGIFYILDIIGETCEKALFIGDSEVDIETGINAKIKTVGVTWGFRDEKALKNADFIAHTTQDILNLF